MNYSVVSEISGNGGVLLIDMFLVFPFLVFRNLETFFYLFIYLKHVDGDVLQCEEADVGKKLEIQPHARTDKDLCWRGATGC